jgi:pyruvate dehydrogenase E1 component alpha subunit
VAEGEFHECLNLAALWRLPILFCCENNLYAMGTAIERAQAETDLALRAASYGMTSWAVDGMDVLDVEDAARRAVEGIRGGGGPCFLELRTYRFRAHSMYGPERYRDKAEVVRWRERDPIELFDRRLTADGQLTPEVREAMTAEVAAEIDRAERSAEADPVEPVEDLTRFVYTEAGGAR